eukprot:4626467-Prymnesium_polylepis.2
MHTRLLCDRSWENLRIARDVENPTCDHRLKSPPGHRVIATPPPTPVRRPAYHGSAPKDHPLEIKTRPEYLCCTTLAGMRIHHANIIACSLMSTYQIDIVMSHRIRLLVSLAERHTKGSMLNRWVRATTELLVHSPLRGRRWAGWHGRCGRHRRDGWPTQPPTGMGSGAICRPREHPS